MEGVESDSEGGAVEPDVRNGRTGMERKGLELTGMGW